MEEHISAKEELPTTTMATVGSGLPMHAGEAARILATINQENERLGKNSS